jgi:small subunit ribosomal protein S4
MGSVRDPKCKMCRREGAKLFLKGDRCMTKKCSVERRRSQDGRVFPPGQHGQVPRRITDYARQLRAKQKMRRVYGVREKQFRRYYHLAERARGVTGDALLQALERRLDNIVYRLGLAVSRRQARQLISHRHFAVNDRPVNIPSYQLRDGDVITVRERSRRMEHFAQVAEGGGRRIPEWLEFDAKQLTGKLVAIPERSQIDTPIDELPVVEFYSRV